MDARTIYLLVGAGSAVFAACILGVLRVQARHARARVEAARTRLTEAQEHLAKEVHQHLAKIVSAEVGYTLKSIPFAGATGPLTTQGAVADVFFKTERTEIFKTERAEANKLLELKA